MSKLFERLAELNLYVLIACVGYSLICGFFFPEIWKRLYPAKNRALAPFLIIKILSYNVAFLLGGFPGAVLAWTVNRGYGILSLISWLVGRLLRGLLTKMKIVRDSVDQD